MDSTFKSKLSCLIGLILFAARSLSATPCETNPDAKPGVLKITSPAEQRIYQRDGKNKARIVLSGTVGLDPHLVSYRILGQGKPTAWKKITRGTSFETTLDLTGFRGMYSVEVRGDVGCERYATARVESFGVGDVYITAGQSNATNTGETLFKTETGLVRALDTSGWVWAQDPQPAEVGDATSFGSTWVLLADLLVDKLKVPIGLVTIGFGGAAILEWAPDGPSPCETKNVPGCQIVRGFCAGFVEPCRAPKRTLPNYFSRLAALLRYFGPNGFKGILWHQGETDVLRLTADGLPRSYDTILSQIISASRAEGGWEIPWYVARVSYVGPQHMRLLCRAHGAKRGCEEHDRARRDIVAAQDAVIAKLSRVYPGADTDALTAETGDRFCTKPLDPTFDTDGDVCQKSDRGDYIHFSTQGQHSAAKQWRDAIVSPSEKPRPVPKKK